MNITPGTLARMAGNIASGLVGGDQTRADYHTSPDVVAERAVEIAEAIAKRLNLTVRQNPND